MRYFIILNLFFVLSINLFAEQDSVLYLIQPDTGALGSKTPLFLIHGWNWDGKPASPTPQVWNNFRNYFQSNDSLKNNFKLYLVCYWANSVSDSSLAKIFRNKIDSINILNPSFLQKKIIIVGHSMGGLISRSMMKHYKFNYGNYTGQYCGERVLRLITLGTPHHGSPMANGPARDAHVAPVRLLMLQFFENTILADVKYNEVNRADIRWDNYDNLLNYNTYPNEKNLWLLNVMNGNALYDDKIIIYTAKYAYTLPTPPFSENQVFDIGGAILSLDFGLDNDGIVPVKSSDFDLHTPLKKYLCNNYNHMQIVTGKTANDTVLFGSIKNDLLSSIITSSHFENNNLPEGFILFQNYPNPFNPVTKIRFSIPQTPLNPPFYKGGKSRSGGGFVSLIIYDILGCEAATLVNEQLRPGTYEVDWDGTNFASGVYFYRIAIHSDKLITENYSETKSMVLIK